MKAKLIWIKDDVGYHAYLVIKGTKFLLFGASERSKDFFFEQYAQFDVTLERQEIESN